MTEVVLMALDVESARRLTERIRYTALGVRDGMEKLQVLVQQAKEGAAHEALGYASWTAYLADTLGAEPLRLPRGQRQELVGYLAGEGMSSRATAPIVGVDHTTILRDLSSGANAPDELPSTVTSLDGRGRPATQPSSPRRTPLPDQARSAGWDLRKAVERLERIAIDDRFTANKDAMAPHLRGHLIHAIEVCQDLLDRINP